jgi:hypothetical protein
MCLSSLALLRRRDLPSPTTWHQQQFPRSSSFFRDLQRQKKYLTCEGGERLLSKVPHGCADLPHLRSSSPESSTQLPAEQMPKVTVGEALLEVRHRSWARKLALPCLFAVVFTDPRVRSSWFKGCTVHLSFRSCSPEKESSRDPGKQQARMIVGEALLAVCHRSWAGKLAFPHLLVGISCDLGERPKSPGSSSRSFLPRESFPQDEERLLRQELRRALAMSKQKSRWLWVSFSRSSGRKLECARLFLDSVWICRVPAELHVLLSLSCELPKQIPLAWRSVNQQHLGRFPSSQGESA